MKLLFSGFRDIRHSKFGGYDWIRFYPEADYICDKDVMFGKLNVGQRGKSLNLLLLDKKTRKKAKDYEIVHYFYGDLGVYSPLPNKRTYKAIVTIHCNTDAVENHHKNIMKCIKSFDAVIVLNSNQCAYLRTKGINAFFVPHGFNRPDFISTDVKSFIKTFDSSKINVVTIGRQYRDYETLKYAIEKNTNSQIHFYLLGQKTDIADLFSNYKNVTICPRFNDDQYYSIIEQCDWAFLPLLYATANNSLMESQYLGIRNILPNISGVTDYASPNENVYYEKSEDLPEIFKNLTKQKPSVFLKEYADKYSWVNVYHQLQDLYITILNK